MIITYQVQLAFCFHGSLIYARDAETQQQIKDSRQLLK
jgi:hypothetical protein